MSPRVLFRSVAFAEAFTWALLLIGMFLKYVTETTEVGVRIGGGLHGFVFLCYLAVAAFTWINEKWPARVGALAILSAVVPFASVPVEKSLDRSGRLSRSWRLGQGGGDTPITWGEKAQTWVLRNPILATVAALAGASAVFSALLVLGPPGTWFA